MHYTVLAEKEIFVLFNFFSCAPLMLSVTAYKDFNYFCRIGQGRYAIYIKIQK